MYTAFVPPTEAVTNCSDLRDQCLDQRLGLDEEGKLRTDLFRLFEERVVGGKLCSYVRT
jgi:hypothetical protein